MLLFKDPENKYLLLKKLGIIQLQESSKIMSSFRSKFRKKIMPNKLKNKNKVGKKDKFYISKSRIDKTSNKQQD